MEELREIAMQVLQTILCGLLSLAGAYAVFYLHKGQALLQAKTQQIQDASQRRLLEDALADVENLATVTVGAIEQTAAKAIREAMRDGATNRDELVNLGKMAFNDIKAKVSPQAQETIAENLGSFDDYLRNLIEAKVLALKAQTGQ